MAVSGENKEDTQMNKMLNENMLDNITPWNSPTLVQQASCHQSNLDNCSSSYLASNIG
jgi:hypothetical protein